MSDVISVKQTAQEKNREIAAANRMFFTEKKVLAVNLISSPGSGKTALLEVLSARLGKSLAVITGDVQTELDAQRITAAGGQAVQIETGGACHLNAEMVRAKFGRLTWTQVRYLVIENVGNLVCPSSYDLGEHEKAAMLSVAEGDEKPVKYPALFVRAGLVIISKIDLLSHVRFNLQRAEDDCRKLNHAMTLLRISSQTGEGLDALTAHFEQAHGRLYSA
jgi:hydrogenase nickel incorporation protein HypB